MIIVTYKMTDEISKLAERIAEQTPSVLAGFRNDNVSILDIKEIVRFYSHHQKVFAVTKNGDVTDYAAVQIIEQPYLMAIAFVGSIATQLFS